MVKCLQENPKINRLFGLFLQVILIFVFLTVFFFSYVGVTEKDSFKLQMNLVVDNIIPDLNIRSFVPPGQEDIATIILDGSLDLARKKSMKTNEEQDKKIKEQNSKIKTKAYKWMWISLGVLGLITIILSICGKCVSLHIYLKEALIVVFFVALTEYIFLELITKNYWSVDPSQVRDQIGNSIQNWIKIHHPLY